jgi:hypothetical protein
MRCSSDSADQLGLERDINDLGVKLSMPLWHGSDKLQEQSHRSAFPHGHAGEHLEGTSREHQHYNQNSLMTVLHGRSAYSMSGMS